MLKIKKAEDFGLGFNCMTRLYMNGYDEEMLDDMLKVCEEYLAWFSARTIVCSLRDLVKEYPFGRNEESVPQEQVERYELLIRNLTRQGISKEKKNSHYKESYIIMEFGDDAGFTHSIWGKKMKFDRDSFYQWVIDNKLNSEVKIKEVKSDEMLPVKKKFLPVFYKVCKYMVRYSYGRHTYMPSTSRDFVKVNMELMSDDALGDIVKYFKERNANIPDDEGPMFKHDSETWIYMQEDLEAELLTREIFHRAHRKEGDVKELKGLLKELMLLDTLHTQKDCLHMYHQLMGIERYLLSVPDDLDMQKILQQLEKGKNVIIKKRWEFFEKEEGHKYEKIGDGVYRKKRDDEVGDSTAK